MKRTHLCRGKHMGAFSARTSYSLVSRIYTITFTLLSSPNKQKVGHLQFYNFLFAEKAPLFFFNITQRGGDNPTSWE